MKILLTGGGTAGHINPAIAIAELLKRNLPNVKIAYAGTPNGLERDLTAVLSCPYYAIRSYGFSRRPTIKNAVAAVRAVLSPIEARRIIRDFRPDLAVGTGGYVCWPILRAAAHEGVPVAIHESNALPGLAVRRLERHADLVMLNFKESAALLKHPEKTLQTGIPLRASFGMHSYKEARKRLGVPKDAFYVLSFGGSLGAETVNRTVVEWMARYGEKKQNLYHLHAAGSYRSNFVECYLHYTRLVNSKERLQIIKYIDDMHLQMAAADLVICRCGAVTLAELSALSKPSILIPSPNVADDHQKKNALLFANEKAATLLEERELSAATLEDAILPYYEAPELRRTAGAAAHRFFVPKSDRIIFNSLMELLGC